MMTLAEVFIAVDLPYKHAFYLMSVETNGMNLIEKIRIETTHTVF